MDSKTLARYVIAKNHPEAARQLLREDFAGWLKDVAARPAAYESAIEAARVSYTAEQVNAQRSLVALIVQLFAAGTVDEQNRICEAIDAICNVNDAPPYHDWLSPVVDAYSGWMDINRRTELMRVAEGIR